MGLLSDGRLVAVWGKPGSSPKIYFAHGDGSSFETPVQLNTAGIPPDIYGFGGLDMAVFENKIFVVFENFDLGVQLLRSEDGGATFLPPVSVYDPPASDWTTLASVAVDAQGNPMVSVIQALASEENARYIMVRSEDGGASFLPPVVASEPAAGEYVCECCPSDIRVAGDTVWLVFRNNFDNLRDIWVSRSTDGGASFTDACDVDATDWVVNACPISGPQLHDLGNDSLLAIWMSAATGPGRIYAATLHGGTMQKGWQFDMPAINSNALQSFPVVAGKGDTICVVYEETGFGVNGAELVYRFSNLGIQNLATVPSANFTQSLGNQRYPSLLFDGETFHLLYQSGGSLDYRRGNMAIINVTTGSLAPGKPVRLVSNPVSTEIVLEVLTEAPMRFSLLSSLGEVVEDWQETNYSLHEIIHLGKASSLVGLYFLRIETAGKVWVEKLVAY